MEERRSHDRKVAGSIPAAGSRLPMTTLLGSRLDATARYLALYVGTAARERSHLRDASPLSGVHLTCRDKTATRSRLRVAMMREFVSGANDSPMTAWWAANIGL